MGNVVKRGGAWFRTLTIGAPMSAVLMSAATAAHAQAVVMAGNYQNFDVLNNTGDLQQVVDDPPSPGRSQHGSPPSFFAARRLRPERSSSSA